MSTDISLGTLERRPARAVWKDEARDFTPWLRQNIGLLGEALGIELDPEVQQEVTVGLFSADLLGTDLGSKASVLIENQLEQTNHSHLGQLLTYAGGLDSRIMVWVSTRIREEHKQALTWLNEVTNEDVLFFGIEIELLSIDGSKPAPHFKVAVAPNEWQKSTSVRGVLGGSTSERNERYREFWSGVIADVLEREPGITSTRPERAPRGSSWAFSPGRGGFGISASFGWEDGVSITRTELYIEMGEWGKNKGAFDVLFRQKDAIERDFGEPLIWSRRDEVRASKIYVKRPGSLDDSEQDLRRHREWFVDKALAMKRVFADRVKAIDASAIAVPPETTTT